MRIKDIIPDLNDEDFIPLMAAVGAFVFATHFTGHIGGGILLAAVLKPYAAFIVISLVFLIHSFFFAAGGATDLLTNIFIFGVIPIFVVYPIIFQPLMRKKRKLVRVLLVTILSAFGVVLLGAFFISLIASFFGNADFFSSFGTLTYKRFLGGLAEGFVTAVILILVYKSRSRRNLVGGFIVASALTGVGVMLREINLHKTPAEISEDPANALIDLISGFLSGTAVMGLIVILAFIISMYAQRKR